MISIIMPTFNESLNISAMIHETEKVISIQDEIIVVDDNSPDNTSDVVKSLMEQYRNLRLITRINEKGLTSAIQRGIEESKGEIVVWLDCDHCQHPKYIPSILEPVLSHECDVSVGSRYVNGGGDSRLSSYKLTVKIQVFLSWFLRKMTSAILLCRFADWSSGFIAIRKEVLKKNGPLFGDYGEYFMILIYKALKNGYRVKEVPYILTAREHGYSKTATNIWGLIRRGRKYLWMIVRLRSGAFD
ncbi:MAG: hypothetical protein OHK0056_33130 [Bacteriovoracaceae bacterium]